jgi:cobalt-zinc-cadmium efflux system protein
MAADPHKPEEPYAPAHPDGHDHAHHDHHRGASQRVLITVLALNSVYMLAEIIGGWYANSLALLSDAGHMFTDVAALALSLMAVRFAMRPATPAKTYGFYRLEILAALTNGVTLIGLALMICYEAYHRFRQPQPVGAATLIWVASGGLLINLISAWMLSHTHEENLNMRGAFLHVMSDLLGSVVAIAAGLLVLWRGWTWADPAFSVIISVLIISSSWKLVSGAVNVLLEGAPSHINTAAVELEMKGIAGVRGVHDLHIWTITSGRHAVTAHVVIDEMKEGPRILRELRVMLAERFSLTHSTIQLEDSSLPTVVQIKKRAAN